MRLSLLVLAAALASPAAAQPPAYSAYASDARAAQLTCRVSGDPVDFPDDLWVTNRGPWAVPAGTRVSWWVSGRAGEHVLKKPLEVGRGVRVPRALPGGSPPGGPCQARVSG